MVHWQQHLVSCVRSSPQEIPCELLTQDTSSPLKKPFRARNRASGGQHSRRDSKYGQYAFVPPGALTLESRPLASKALFQRTASLNPAKTVWLSGCFVPLKGGYGHLWPRDHG